MIRNQFSYWFTATLPDGVPNRDTLIAILVNACQQSPLSDCMVFEATSDGISGEVNPKAGTIEEDSSILNDVALIAAAHPLFDIEFQECDEDDKSNRTTTKYHDGVQTWQGCARTLEPDEYDRPTVDAICDYLDSAGHASAAALIRNSEFFK